MSIILLWSLISYRGVDCNKSRQILCRGPLGNHSLSVSVSGDNIISDTIHIYDSDARQSRKSIELVGYLRQPDPPTVEKTEQRKFFSVPLKKYTALQFLIIDSLFS